MPGLYGIIGSNNGNDNFDKIAQILNRYDYKINSYLAKNITIGRQHLGILFPLPQPVWDRSRTCGIMADGYVIIDESIADSQEKSAQTLGKLVAWYRKEGDSFINHIRTGIFNILLIDLKEQKVKIINDRLGLLPIYCGFDEQGGLVFAPEEKALIKTGIVDGELDWTGIAEIMHFRYAIGNRTLYKNIKLMPAASIMEYDLTSKNLIIHQYHHVSYNTNNNLTLKQCAEIGYEKLKTSCRRVNVESGKYALLLSGGLDSRLILSAWDNRINMTAYTYADATNDETKIASKLTKAANIKHKVCIFTESEFCDTYQEALYNMESLSYGIHTKLFHDINADGNNFVLDGFLGDALLGGLYFRGLHPPKSALYSTDVHNKPSNILAVAQQLKKDMSWGNSSLLVNLLNDKIGNIIKEHEPEILNDIIAGIKAHYDEYQYSEQIFETFKLVNRGRRYINQQGLVARFLNDIVYPFYDYEFIDFIYTVPLVYRVGQNLMFSVYRHIGNDLSRTRRAEAFLAPASFNTRVQKLGIILYYLMERITRTAGYSNHYYNLWYRNNGDFTHFINEELLRTPDLINAEKMENCLKLRTNKQFNLISIMALTLEFIPWWKMFIEK